MLLHFRILKGSWAALACSSITLYTDGFLLLLYICIYAGRAPSYHCFKCEFLLMIIIDSSVKQNKTNN
jgi:hypothetical protein